MRRTAWSKAITAILRAEEAKPFKETLAAYDRLLAKTERASRGMASDWELAEVMFVRACFLEQRGMYSEAFQAYMKVAEFRRQQMSGSGHSLASALEAAVAVGLRAGKRRKAVSLAQEVVRLRGQFPYASDAFETVVRLLRDDQRRLSRRAERQHSRGRR